MEETLVAWLNTFQPLNKDVTSYEDLLDGIILADILSQMIPEYLDKSDIKSEAETNDLLKIYNLKHILESLQSFYENEVFSHSINVQVDVNKIVEEKKFEEMEKLIQFMVGVAVQCDKRVEYVNNIQTMDGDAQREIMMLLNEILPAPKEQEFESNDDHSYSNDKIQELEKESLILKEELKKAYEREEKSKTDIEKLHLDNQELETLVQNLTKELDETKKQLKEVQEKTESKQMYSKKQMELEETIKVKQSLELELESRDQEITKLKKQLDALSKVEAEVSELRDENDILKEQSSKVKTLEERITKYQKKVETMNELKKQVKLLEEKNDEYLRTKLDNEDHAKRLSNLRSQLDSYKDQVTNLTAEKESLLIKFEEREKEALLLQQKAQSLEEENQLKDQKIQDLRNELETLKQEYESQGIHSQEDSLEGVTDLSMKEKIYQLQRENEKLRKGEGTARVTELENQLDDARRLNKKYAQDIETLKKQLTSKNIPSSPNLSSEQKGVEFSQLQDKYEMLVASNKELEHKNKEQVQRIEKLEGYLRIAKTMINEEKGKNKKLEQEHQELTRENQALKKIKEDIEKKLEQGRTESEREIKLLSGMIYSVGLELQRLKAPKISTTGEMSGSRPKPKAFLNKAREDS